MYKMKIQFMAFDLGIDNSVNLKFDNFVFLTFIVKNDIKKTRYKCLNNIKLTHLSPVGMLS